MIDPPRIFSVLEFTEGLVKLFGRPGLQNIAIRGELSGVGDFGNGHLKFTLKERQAVLECIAWSDRRGSFPPLRDGMAVVARGAVRVRAERSSYQFQVDSVELVGVGELFARYEELKARFRAEGLFDPARKRPAPKLPRRIAVVSARGKAMEDFIGTIEHNVPFVELAFIETRVQGQGAEIDIAAALDEASRRNVDIVVLTRGGGSYEDLFSFNQEPVVRAIVRSRHPVVTAIGHSGDHHLADDVADMTFGTPSLAAEYVAKSWLSAIQRLKVAVRDLGRAIRTRALAGEDRLERASSNLARSIDKQFSARRTMLGERLARIERLNPQRRLDERRSRLADLRARLHALGQRTIDPRRAALVLRVQRLDTAGVRLLSRFGQRIERAGASLRDVDPLRPLERGYAIVSHDGRALTDAAAVAPGDLLSARLHRGTLTARVERAAQDE